MANAAAIESYLIFQAQGSQCATPHTASVQSKYIGGIGSTFKGGPVAKDNIIIASFTF